MTPPFRGINASTKPGAVHLEPLNTHFPLTSAEVSITEGVSFQLPLGGQFSRAVDTPAVLFPDPDVAIYTQVGSNLIDKVR